MAFRRIISAVTTTANHHIRRHSTTASIPGRFLHNGNLKNGSTGPWFMYPKSDSFCFHLDMPGVDNSNLKYSVSGSEISVSAQEPKVHRFGLGRVEARYYEVGLKVDPVVYKPEEVKAEVKNGGLWVIVPKIRAGVTNGWVEIKMGCLKIEFDGIRSCVVRHLETNEFITKATAA